MDNLGQHIRRLERSLDLLHTKVNTLLQVEKTEMGDLTKLNASVAALKDPIASIKTMVDGLRANDADLQKKLDDLIAQGNDQEAIDAAQAAVDENKAALDSILAVAANTPAAT